MSDQQSNEPTGAEVEAAKQEAADHVVERVESWQDGAEKHTVREELQEGMRRAEVEVSDEELDRVAEKIHDEGRGDSPRVE